MFAIVKVQFRTGRENSSINSTLEVVEYAGEEKTSDFLRK